MSYLPANINQQLLRIRLFNSVEIVGTCWEWTKSCCKSGYGKFGIGKGTGKDYMAHRAMYELTYGELPSKNSTTLKDLPCVLHRCDNKKCINPDHLFLGTHSENSIDMVKKGRHFCYPKTRTHCPKGHEYSGKNINGARICKICNRETVKKYNERKKHGKLIVNS